MDDFRVYSAIASGCRKGNVSSLGMRLISTMTGVLRGNVAASIGRLSAYGYIHVNASRKGSRFKYVLRSDVFAKSPERDNQEPPAPEKPECPRCHVLVKALAKDGQCRKCSVAIKEERIYEAARAVLGQTATHADVVAYIIADSNERKWRRAQRSTERKSRVA